MEAWEREKVAAEAAADQERAHWEVARVENLREQARLRKAMWFLLYGVVATFVAVVLSVTNWAPRLEVFCTLSGLAVSGLGIVLFPRSRKPPKLG